MPNRTAKFASAVFASLLRGTPLATVSHGAAPAADDCLSGPKGQRQKAAIGTTASNMPPNATAGICAARRRGNANRADDRVRQRIGIRQSDAPKRQRCRLGRRRPRRTAPRRRRRGDRTAACRRGDNCPPRTVSPTARRPANCPDANTPRSVVASRWPEQLAATFAGRRRTGRGQSGCRRAVDLQRRRQPPPRPRPARRRGSPRRKTVRLDPDAVDRHCRRAVAGRPHAEARFSDSAANGRSAKSARSAATGARSGIRSSSIVHCRRRRRPRRRAAADSASARTARGGRSERQDRGNAGAAGQKRAA